MLKYSDYSQANRGRWSSIWKVWMTCHITNVNSGMPGEITTCEFTKRIKLEYCRRRTVCAVVWEVIRNLDSALQSVFDIILPQLPKSLESSWFLMIYHFTFCLAVLPHFSEYAPRVIFMLSSNSRKLHWAAKKKTHLVFERTRHAIQLGQQLDAVHIMMDFEILM